MAYNLPPPWSPKYAYPANTRVEALQRGTFTTRQQPSGSYDDPRVGTAGYAVPGYVTAQPYGQGAMVTKWMPRGTVVGRVPHWLQQPNFAVLAQTRASGDGNAYEIGPPIESVHADPFESYGARVADQVMLHLKRLAPPHRKPALKALFHKIDPKLYSRVMATATRAARAGIPPQRALHHAIGVEARSGFLRELHSIGISGHVKVGSQTGLGCWGCAALGDTLGATPTLAVSKSAVAAIGAGTVAPGVQVHRVHNADGSYTEYCTENGKTVPCGSGQLAQTPNKGIANPMGPIGGQTVTVGPFSFQVGFKGLDWRNFFNDPNKLTTAQRGWLEDQIKSHVQAYGNSYGAALADPRADLITWFPDGNGKWYSASEDTIDSDYKSPDGVKFAVNPLVGNIPDPTNPTGEKLGVYLWICGANCGPVRTGLPADNGSKHLLLVLAPMSMASQTAWSGFYHGVGDAIGGFIGAVGDAIGGIACDVLGHPAAATAAAAATGGAAGTGVKLASAICQSNAPAPMIGPAPSTFGSDLEIAAVVAGGLGLIYMLTHRRKRSDAPRASSRRSTRR